MKRRDLLGGLAAATGLGLIGCRAEPPPATLVDLRMACDPWCGYYVAVLAEADGDFAREGLRVSMERSTTTDRMLAEFHAGRFDLVGASLGDFIPMAARGRDLGIVLSSDESSGADKVFRRRDFDPATSDRLRMGTDLNGFGEVFMREFLAQAGLGDREVQWLHVDAADVGRALDDGQIDFGNCWEPYASAITAAGHAEVFDSSRTPALVTQVLVAKRALIEGQPEALRGFCRAWFTAADRWLADPAGVGRRVEGLLGLVPGEGSLAGIRLHTREDNDRLLRGPSPAIVPVMQRYAEFHASRGEAPGDLDFLLQGLVLP